ncbi:MAG TPA: hypothetical protein VFC78_21910 [Tepidisphaeraceae bacterium]|nr:hypothetical protein [Tepidisphaeraceae bacterium]
MHLPERAIEVLLSAERLLASLAHEASESRDYDGATALLEAARRVKLLGSNGTMVVGALNEVPPTEIAASSLPFHRPTPPKRSRKGDYPKFVRDGDSLVKVGWSKTEKAEYEHRSPKRVSLVLATALAEAGAKGRRFTMDNVLPLNDPTDSTPLPDYQCYLCLAWLRREEIVIQHGRQGYSVPKNGDLPTAVERAWARLPVRA